MQACSGHSATTQGCNAGQRCSGSAALRLTGDVHAMKLAGEISWHLITFQICQQTMKQTIGMTLFLLNCISCLGVYKCIMFAAAPQLNNYVFEFIGVMTEIHRALWSWSHETHHHNGSWWRHQMETFSALLAICAGNSPVPGELPAQRPVTRSFDAFFDLRPNKRLSKHSRGWWFETPSRPLWRHCNVKSASSTSRTHVSLDLRVLNSSPPPDKLSSISQITFSNEFSWMKNFVFRFKFHWSLFLRAQLTIIQHSGNGLVPNRRLAITRTNVYPVYRRIYATIGVDE